MNAVLRQLVLVNLVASVLLIVHFAIRAAALAPYLGAADVRKLPGLDANLESLLINIGFARALLFAVGVVALAAVARAGWAGALGALVTVVGQALLVIQVVFPAIGRPQPLNALLGPAFVGAGAVIFGLAVYRANVLSRRGALLLVFFTPTGLFGLVGPNATTLLFGTDFGLAPSTFLRMYGDLAMLAVAAAWILMTLSARLLPSAVRGLAPRPAVS